MASSSYPIPPPAYTNASASQSKPGSAERDPLLRGGAGGGFYEQPEAGDLPDDFKVC